MSRRESRVSGTVRQNDALFEYEALKKKFLHANKAITKLNSTLSIRVEELNAELSALYVENLRLRTSELALAAQLKQEREKSRKIIADAETAALNLTKQLEQLRQCYTVDVSPPTPPTPPSPKAHRPPLMPNAETQMSRISRPPNVSEIHEEDEPDSTESDTDKPNPFQRRTTAKSRSPVSGVPRQTRPTSPPLRIDLGATSHRKKPSRRQSGILNVNKEALALQRPPSPTFRSPIRKAVSLAQEDDENEGIDVINESKSKHKNKVDYIRDSKYPDKAPLDNDRLMLKSRERKRPRDEDESDRNEEPIKQVSRFALQPIDNTVQDSEDKNAVKGLLVSSTNHSTTTQTFAPSLPNVISETETDAASNGRERRTRKSVNYAEPKLNTKMRKPDPPPGSETTMRKKRSSAAAVMTTTTFKPREAEAKATDAGNTGSDTESGTSPPPYSHQVIDSKPVPTNSLALASIRKKFRPKLPSDGENSDGAEADEEYIPPGRPSWINVEGRKRNNQSRRPLSTTLDLDIETEVDSRRHSLAV